MIKDMADYLGRPISQLLETSPFNNWPVERSEDNDLDEPNVDYIFLKNGMSVSSDQNDRISVMFFYSNEYKGFRESLIETPFTWHRQQVIEHFGAPSESGGKLDDPILGQYGPWDRFYFGRYTVHFQYQADKDAINMITLMRNDVVP